jgi:hypothetical protein
LRLLAQESLSAIPYRPNIAPAKTCRKAEELATVLCEFVQHQNPIFDRLTQVDISLLVATRIA